MECGNNDEGISPFETTAKRILEHQSSEIVGIAMKSRGEGIPYGPMAKKPNAKGGAAFNAWPTNST